VTADDQHAFRSHHSEQQFPFRPREEALGEMLTNLQYRILRTISPGEPDCCSGCVYEGKSKLAILIGEELFTKIAGKVIIDFGCGGGAEAIEMTRRGAKRVIGIDIREDVLEVARQRAVNTGVQNACLFVSSTKELADMIVSVDAFEHFGDPAVILHTMNMLLQPAGEVLVSFGPTWYHPLGGHLFSVFPWAHLIFSEKALIRWRSTLRTDGATRFSEVAGGLNQMTIAKFEKLIAASPFKLANLELVPIKKLRCFHNRFTREFTTAIVRCRMVKRI
jgi:SAM-dependent methyltransferase